MCISPVALSAPKLACLDRMSPNSQTSLLHTLRNAGASIADFPKTIAARAIDPEVDTPLPAFGKGTDGTAIFWMGSDKVPVVDARVLGPLKTAHVTQMKAGESVQVGRIADPEATALAEVSKHLIHAGIILTYVHIGAELCVERESTQKRRIISGSHTYFTQTENKDEVRFSVVLGPGGIIEVHAL